MDSNALQHLNTIEQNAYALKANLQASGLAHKAEALLAIVNDIRRQLATEANVPSDKRVLHG